MLNQDPRQGMIEAVEAELRKRLKADKVADVDMIKDLPDPKAKGVKPCKEDGKLYVSDGKRWKPIQIDPGVPQ